DGDGQQHGSDRDPDPVGPLYRLPAHALCRTVGRTRADALAAAGAAGLRIAVRTDHPKGRGEYAYAPCLPGGTSRRPGYCKGAPDDRRSAATTADDPLAHAQPSFGWVLITLGRLLIDCHQRLRRGAPDSSLFPSGVPLK